MGEVFDFKKANTAVEMIKNELEDDNILSLVTCMSTKDGDLFILDAVDGTMGLEEVSFFAYYFETLRQSIMQEMMKTAEPV
jgi:hypothetical protein